MSRRGTSKSFIIIKLILTNNFRLWSCPPPRSPSLASKVSWRGVFSHDATWLRHSLDIISTTSPPVPPPSLQMRGGGGVFSLHPQHHHPSPLPRFKCESEGSLVVTMRHGYNMATTQLQHNTATTQLWHDMTWLRHGLRRTGASLPPLHDTSLHRMPLPPLVVTPLHRTCHCPPPSHITLCRMPVPFVKCHFPPLHNIPLHCTLHPSLILV